MDASGKWNELERELETIILAQVSADGSLVCGFVTMETNFKTSQMHGT